MPACHGGLCDLGMPDPGAGRGGRHREGQHAGKGSAPGDKGIFLILGCLLRIFMGNGRGICGEGV